MSVKTTHPDYDRMAPKWKRCRDTVAGQDAVHAAGEAYLPKLKDETDTDYSARRKRSDYFNGTWRTIDGLGGMAFRKSPTVEVPAGCETYLDDVTMSGVSMDALAASVVEDVLEVGRIFVLVDHPPRPANVTAITINVAEELGLRPTLQVYTAESLINWKFRRVANGWRLAMAVLKECEAIAKDEFEDTLEDRYRVLDLDAEGFYRQRVFMIDKKGKDVLLSEFYPTMNGKPLTYIPGAIIGPNGKGDCIDVPPLIDLVDANLALYQINADYRHGLHFTGLPTPYVTGWSPPTNQDGTVDKLYIGSSSAWVFTDPGAQVGFLEFQGQGLDAMRLAIGDKKQEMALLGARMIADETKQVETLGATQIKRAGENSILSRIVQAVSDGLEWCLGVFCEWAGHGGEVTYQLNRDFNPMMMDAQQLTALVGAVQAGQISSEEFFDLCQRGDLIKADVTFEEHQEQIDAGGVPKPTMPAPPKVEAA